MSIIKITKKKSHPRLSLQCRWFVSCVRLVCVLLCFMWEMIVSVLCGRWSSLYYVGDDRLCFMWEMIVSVLCGRWSSLYYVGDDRLCIMWEMIVSVLCGRWSSLYCVGDDHLCIMWEMIVSVLCLRSSLRRPMAERVGCGTPCLLWSLGVREVVGSRPGK